MRTRQPIVRSCDSLIDMLTSGDAAARLRARRSLVDLGPPAVAPLGRLLLTTTSRHVRWEAVKALGDIGDPGAITALVRALGDSDPDVRWCAAEALIKFKHAAWPSLLRTLIRSGPDSALLRQAAHHVLRNQDEDGFTGLLSTLTKALESTTAPVATKMAAYNILRRMPLDL